MAVKRVVSTDFWVDGKVVDQFSPEDKYFMLYLLTNPHTKQLGIYKFNLKIAAFELGYSQEAVKVLLDRFDTKYGLVKYSEEHQELAILNYLKHGIVKGGKPVQDCLVADLKLVKDEKLLVAVYNKLCTMDNTITIDFIKREIEKRIKDKYNDNDNDNDSIVGVSYHDSSHDSSETEETSEPVENTGKESKKPSKHKYGEYKNVLLTDEEYMKLQREFPNTRELITYLDEYVEMKGYKAKSHYLAIRKWVVNAVKEQAQRANKATGTHGKPKDDTTLRQWIKENGGNPDELDGIR